MKSRKHLVVLKTALIPTVIAAAVQCFAAPGGNIPIKNGVHGYTPKGYVTVDDPIIRERLEWYMDQKLALFLHFGIYSQIGTYESWPLCDNAGKWPRKEIDWTNDMEEFKRDYIGLIRSFNPIRLRPDHWAQAAKENGFKYLIFTAKHHDGFCLWDTKYTDYKVTSPKCPFSTNKRADILKSVFDEFRAKGVPVVAYFSKPDWNHNDYWENSGLGRKVGVMPSYNTRINREKWNRFREFTRGQMLELVKNYGRIEALWLDGGQVQKKYGTDIKIEEIIAEARKTQPWMIFVDRAVGGIGENVITPEKTVPKTPIAVPWESCVPAGDHWGYHYENTYKSPRELLHLLIDIVGKGGNLALGIGPQPDGRLPVDAVELMKEMGKWLKVNGEAIYGTRSMPPFKKGEWVFSRNRHTGNKYAIRLWKENEKPETVQSLPYAGVKEVRHVGSGAVFKCSGAKDPVSFELPPGFKADPVADVFMLK